MEESVAQVAGHVLAALDRRASHAEEVRKRRQQDYSVFISYSHRDIETRVKITDVLNSAGVFYQVDEKSLAFGDSITKFAEYAIAECSDYLLVVSEHSLRSPWCNYELGFARGRDKRVLLFTTGEDVSMPHFGREYLSTSSLGVLSAYFAKARLDEEAVRKFVQEILEGRDAQLAKLVPSAEPSHGASTWQVPNYDSFMTARETRTPLPEPATGPDGLLQLSIHEGEKTLTMASQAGGGLWKRELYYEPRLQAIVVNARGEYLRYQERNYGDRLAVRRTDSSGEEIFELGKGGIQDDLGNKVVRGWMASEDFWSAALADIKGRLYGG